MINSSLKLAFAYLRLSIEEAKEGESGSITNQRLVIDRYCQQQNITLVREFVDDGYSGGNFQRPGFQEMLRQLEQGKANIVITKDLSRLGRDMREASYYAEQFLPEHGIRYLALADNFDTDHENIMAPFQFAMNEVYLRDGSRKVKDVLKSKRESGQYCACPPYGYLKNPQNKARLMPDEATAPVVRRIFEQAAAGDSSRKIALDLNADGVIPPLKYRSLYRDEFSAEGAARASDLWNYTTVKRVLKNQVYLGDTLLGKSKKVSVKSTKKMAVPKELWAVTKNTHEALITQALFDKAQIHLGKGSSDFRSHTQIRKSIFSGLVRCAKCGHALCSCGTVYKGEREKYWYLACINQRQDISNPCTGTRIRYADLLEVVRQDLNGLLALSDGEIEGIVQDVYNRNHSDAEQKSRQARLEKSQSRIITIDKVVTKLYTDNAEGRIDDDRLRRMVSELEKESAGLRAAAAALAVIVPETQTRRNYEAFLALAKRYTHLDTLDRETLLTFVERIEVGPKEPQSSSPCAGGAHGPFHQRIRIFYRFIGELAGEPIHELSKAANS